jgi:hypothetical protein
MYRAVPLEINMAKYFCCHTASGDAPTSAKLDSPTIVEVGENPLYTPGS